MMNKTMYNIVYIEQFDCRYIEDRYGVIHIVVERKHMQDIENSSIPLFEDQTIRVAWDEQQEELKPADLWLLRRMPTRFVSWLRTL